MYVMAGGKCAECGGPLGDDWEAHHVVRYADGGVTEVTNGAALCVQCHRNLSRSRFMFEPRGWQIEGLRKFSKGKKAFLLEATPGAGKTVFSALAAKTAIESGAADFCVVVVPTTALKGDETGGFLCDWNKVGVQLTTVLKDGRDAPKEFRGGVITYQQLPNIITTFETWAAKGLRLFVVLDEAHHASLNNKWGAATERLGAASTRTLSMTGTPFRGDRQRISFVNYNDEQMAVADYAYRYAEAVRDKNCRPIVFMTDDGFAEFVRYDDDFRVRLSDAKDEDLSDVSATIFRKGSKWLAEVILRADSKLDEYRTFDIDAGGIIVCRPGADKNDDRHLQQVARLVKEMTGDHPEVITHDDPEANTKIARFRRGTARWICSVRKISEGVDIKRLRVMVMAARPSTELLFRQLVGRVVRVDDKIRPGDATVFIAKFTQLCEWAEQIRDEAKAGLVEQDELRKKSERIESSNGDYGFEPRGSSHENGGAISDLGETFIASEVIAAEHLKKDDPILAHISVTTIAHILRKQTSEPPTEIVHGKPLHAQKLEKRKEIDRLVKYTAIKENPKSPDFRGIWKSIGSRFGAWTMDDLMDNKPIEVMDQVIAFLKAWRANNNASS